MELKEFKTRLANAASKEDRISLLDSHADNLFEKGRYGEAGEFYQ